MATKVTVEAKRYEDYDDCLSAAAEEYADDHGIEAAEVTAEWEGGEDGERERIVLTVPAGSVIPSVDRWHVPAQRQGQVVEHAFGCDEDGTAWERITDSSVDVGRPGRVTYERLGIAAETWDPANGVLDVESDDHGRLVDYQTTEVIRAATAAEQHDSHAAALRDGGRGVIEVDGRRCYVED